ncbi:MAG: Na+/H+ antiporter NhaC family protein [Clostridia bacterium]|jgi:Na+/H+ antiporter NhaC|nr:Na+/H+ antiporter NhaC family protein [Clostridia bacterium]
MNKNKQPALALLPLATFLIIFLGTGFYLHYIKEVEFAFYQLPAPVAAFMGLIVGIIVLKGSLNEKVDIIVRGIGNSNIIIMCLVFLLAGAFAATADAMGGVESTVNLGVSIIPSSLLLPGIFVISSFIATAMGTSMGTIGAMAPIAIGIADKTGIGLAIAVGAVVGGAMFGDNLSMISDTTIAATRTQGADMKDKFRANFFIALPAALLTIILLTFFSDAGVITGEYPYQLIKVIPYFLVLVLALLGLNVFAVLTIGIFSAGIIGLISGDFGLLELTQTIYAGFTSMQEIFLLSFLTGGLVELTREYGGLDYLLTSISSRIRTKKGAELGIAGLVSLADIATANNTVAIVLSGPIAKDIAEKHGVEPKRSASIIDIFSCVWQGIIPYGAQILLAGSLANLSPFAIIPTLWYQFTLAFFAILAILIGFPRSSSTKQAPSL